jgi:hypothetical protein
VSVEALRASLPAFGRRAARLGQSAWTLEASPDWLAPSLSTLRPRVRRRDESVPRLRASVHALGAGAPAIASGVPGIEARTTRKHDVIIALPLSIALVALAALRVWPSVHASTHGPSTFGRRTTGHPQERSPADAVSRFLEAKAEWRAGGLW